MAAFVRRTPISFWFGLMGIAFFAWVFFTRFWDFQSGFAVILMAGYLAVAVLSVVPDRGARVAGLVIAAMGTALEAGLALLFLFGPEQLTGVVLSHATGAVLAGAAAVALLLAIRGAPGRTLVSRPHGS